MGQKCKKEYIDFKTSERSRSVNSSGPNTVSVTFIRFFDKDCYEPTKVKGKGKAIPLHAWTGPEGSRRLRLPDFKTIGT
jgi:hypothetical protein